MRKEVLFAIVAGALFGLVVAFGIWRANISLKGQEVSENGSGEVSTTAPSTPVGNLGLVIAKPEQNTVFTEAKASISGITKPNAWVSISGEKEDYIIKSGEDGSFSEDVVLSGGVNEIIVTSFEEGGNYEESVTVVYSSEFDEAPASLRSGFLLLSLRRERNPAEAENTSRSSSGLRLRYSAKEDKTTAQSDTNNE